jgi:hypothetical protein
MWRPAGNPTAQSGKNKARSMRVSLLESRGLGIGCLPPLLEQNGA